MTKVDQFESVFRSAVKDVYLYQQIEFKQILIVTDLLEEEAGAFVGRIKQFCQVIDKNIRWEILYQQDFSTTHDLLEKTSKIAPDLIFTYRNLHSEAWRYPHSLGEHLDVLIQMTSTPVMVLPNPKADFAVDHALVDTNVVMAVTDHLSNDHDLVNYAIRLTEKNGQLYLVHIEDSNRYDRYIDIISKISSIDTDSAAEEILKQLLKEPGDYIQSVREILTKENLSIEVKEIIECGHHLTQYRKHIEAQKVDLLVINTQDKQQMAMHGLAYPLAVELRHIPLLMI